VQSNYSKYKCINFNDIKWLKYGIRIYVIRYKIILIHLNLINTIILLKQKHKITLKKFYSMEYGLFLVKIDLVDILRGINYVSSFKIDGKNKKN